MYKLYELNNMKRKLNSDNVKNIEDDNLSILLNLYYQELKKTPSKIYYNSNEWINFYMDNDYYNNIINNIEVGDMVVIKNLEESIWCEVIRTHKNYKENEDLLIENKKLLVRIDNIVNNNHYSFNTYVEIKITNIIDFCKKDELFYRYCKI